MNVALLGGCGYVGSVVAQELMKETTVELIDNVLFSDEYSSSCMNFKKQDVLLDKIDYSEYDAIVWMIDIDYDEFYMIDFAQQYVTLNNKIFGELAKEFKSKMFVVSEDYTGNIEPYDNFLLNREAVCHDSGVNIVKLPSLYGPSSRMRFDTVLNDMFKWGYVSGRLGLIKWLKKIKTCSVAIAGKYIAESVLSGKFEYEKIATYNLSVVEYANIINKVFDNKLLMVLDDDLKDDYEYDSDVTVYLPRGRHDIHADFEYMLKNIERDISDVMKDRYNNTKILDSFTALQGFFEFKKRLENNLGR